MFLNIHTLFDLPVSCLNRDDMDRPKTAVVDGIERMRVSSQSLKSAYRKHLKLDGLDVAARTKYIHTMIKQAYAAAAIDQEESQIHDFATGLMSVIGLKVDEKRSTDELVVATTLASITSNQISAAVRAALDINAEVKITTPKKTGKTQDSTKEYSLQSSSHTATQIKEVLTTALNTELAVDQVLFGRMYASIRKLDVDAAAQVAHMIGTGPVQVESDFFTGVDDLYPGDDAGAGHMGTKRFTAGVAYGYSTLNLNELVEQFDADLTQAIVDAYLRVVTTVLPSGSQNGYAARVFADTVLVTISDNALNLSPAFASGIISSNTATQALIDRANAVDRMYGGVLEPLAMLCTLHDEVTVPTENLEKVDSVAAISASVKSHLNTQAIS